MFVRQALFSAILVAGLLPSQVASPVSAGQSANQIGGPQFSCSLPGKQDWQKLPISKENDLYYLRSREGVNVLANVYWNEVDAGIEEAPKFTGPADPHRVAEWAAGVAIALVIYMDRLLSEIEAKLRKEKRVELRSFEKHGLEKEKWHGPVLVACERYTADWVDREIPSARGTPYVITLNGRACYNSNEDLLVLLEYSQRHPERASGLTSFENEARDFLASLRFHPP